MAATAKKAKSSNKRGPKATQAKHAVKGRIDKVHQRRDHKGTSLT